MEKLLKTDKDIEQFLFWIGTLQAEVFKQTRGCLQSGDSYCCLGVGVACTTREKALEHWCGGMHGCLVEDQPSAPKWLQEINDYCYERFDYVLTTANDSGTRHREIANFLLDKFEKGLL